MKTTATETQQTQASQRMKEAINKLTKRIGILIVDYRRAEEHAKYYITAECTTLIGRKLFIVTHEGDIFSEGKPFFIRCQYKKPTYKASQTEIV